MKKKYRFRDYNYLLVLFVVAVSVIGVLAIGSARSSLQGKQMVGAIGGFFIMLVISFFDYGFFLKFYWIFYAANLILLTLVRFVGINRGGAQRWFTILGIQFQPSEAAKILLILFYAEYIMVHREVLNRIRTVLTMVLLFIPPIVLIYMQPDLSTSIVIVVVFIVMLFVGGISKKIMLGAAAVTIPAFVILMMLILQPNQKLIHDFQQKRILAWLYPNEYENTEGYQQQNSITAIGSGQLMGKGLNNNSISSVKNGNFISEPQTDFIFAVIGEELGFVGSASTVILLFGIALMCFNTGRKAKDAAGSVICAGVGCIIAFQSFINISVATGLFPNTGIPLPFVSYGLTSLICLYIGIGFVLNIRLQCIKKY